MIPIIWTFWRSHAASNVPVSKKVVWTCRSNINAIVVDYIIQKARLFLFNQIASNLADPDIIEIPFFIIKSINFIRTPSTDGLQDLVFVRHLIRGIVPATVTVLHQFVLDCKTVPTRS